jgi:methylated-DNA-[protein]-cysteine S-methyltransferase
MSGPTATVLIESPIGGIKLTANRRHLLSVHIGLKPHSIFSDDSRNAILKEATAQITNWFLGERQGFDLPLAPLESGEGQKLRSAIASIPYGETQSYGALATRFGSVARAVGQGCKTNPYPIIIPCHRVVSASGPEYYSGGGGPRTKSWLIDFEYANLPPDKRTRLI